MSLTLVKTLNMHFKNYLLIAIVSFFIGVQPVEASVPKPEATPAPKLSTTSAISTELLLLTPRKYREQTGKRMSIEEIISLKLAQKKLRKALANEANGTGSSGKSQTIALVLVLLLGGLGIHRFYLGYIGIGIIQLLTLGGCGIWALVDLILIITGDLKPKGSEYEETL